jgi:hypothetical protein
MEHPADSRRGKADDRSGGMGLPQRRQMPGASALPPQRPQRDEDSDWRQTPRPLSRGEP